MVLMLRVPSDINHRADTGQQELTTEDVHNLKVHGHLEIRPLSLGLYRIHHNLGLMADKPYHPDNIIGVPQRATSQCEIIIINSNISTFIMYRPFESI
jgi:hypothetical protein